MEEPCLEAGNWRDRAQRGQEAARDLQQGEIHSGLVLEQRLAVEHPLTVAATAADPWAKGRSWQQTAVLMAQ